MIKRFTEFLEALEIDNSFGFLQKSDKRDTMQDILPDESLYWNVEDTDNAGFIIPVERYSDDWRLYRAATRLIKLQRMFLRKIICPDCLLQEQLNVGTTEFCPVKIFGCGSMSELYNYYMTIFEGKIGYNGFCEVFEDYLSDENGVLSINCSRLRRAYAFYVQMWKIKVNLLYDVSDCEANIIVSLSKSDKGSEVYRFTSMRMKKSLKEWRLEDSCLFII